MQKSVISSLIHWFRKNRRDLPWRKTRDLYEIWVSEIMLQQTQVKTVIPYYECFLSVYPTIADLSKASEEEVLKIWQGLGYYSRAIHLFQSAQKIRSEHRGKIPSDPGEFGKLPGVGEYVSAAVLSISKGLPLPAVDGNVMRVYCRLESIAMDIRVPGTRKWIKERLEKIIEDFNPGEFNQAFMELGACICKPKNPQCSSCPIAYACQAFKSRQVLFFPIKSVRPKIPEFAVSLAVIRNRNRFFIQKRPSRGHLAGMWEFPGGKVKPHETLRNALIRECWEELKVKIKIIEKLASVQHAYTHFKVDIAFFLCLIPRGDKIITDREFRWITFQQIKDFPFPGANHKFFPILKSHLDTESPFP